MWAPSTPTLEKLALLFQQSNDGRRESRAQRSTARAELEAARSQPDLVKYLVYLLVSPGVPDEIRATSGLWLKNVLASDWFSLNEDAVQYVQQEAPRGLADSSQLVRNTSSIVLTTLVSKIGLARWPNLLPQLVAAIDGAAAVDGATQEGAVGALRNICEDHAHVVAEDEQLFSQLVPKLIEFTKSTSARVRSYAVACLTEFVPLGSAVFLLHIDDFLQSCFTLAQTDSSPETLQSICRAFTELLQVRPDKLVPHMQGVVQFAVHCLQRRDEEPVALEGAEFLLALSESDADDETLAPLLPLVVEPLLAAMVFSDEDLFVLESLAEDDSAQADRDQDIRPQHAKHRRHRMGGTAGGADGADGDDDDDDDDDLEASLQDWNLRKCSATTIDHLAQKCASAVAELALPLLLQRINAQQEWPVRESAVLAFGAIATGVQQAGETAFADELVPFLVGLLRDAHAPIREISCWTLGRYAAEREMQLDVLQGVLACMLDVNKRVQAAACAALSTLSESANGQLDPLARELLEHLRLCFAKYQKNNLLALYECVQIVTTSVSASVKEQPQIARLVMEPMLARWNVCGNDDYELLALLETFSFLAVAIGPAFAEYAAPLFERSVLLARDGLVLLERAAIAADTDAPDPMVVACGIDMIDGLVQALGGDGMAPLFAAQQQSTQTSIVDLLQMGLTNGFDSLEIKQSALSLVGDLAVYCFDEQLLPYCAQLVPEIARLVDAKVIADNGFYEPVGDNSMWALAEISMHHDKFSMEPYFNDVFQRLGSVLCSPEIYSPSLLWNAAIALGRLGLGSARLLAPHLHMFIEKYLEVMMDVDATEEKDTSLQGICLTIAANPTALNEQGLQQFFKVLAGYFAPSPELKLLVKKVYDGYKSITEVDQIVGRLAPAFQQQLRAAYSL